MSKKNLKTSTKAITAKDLAEMKKIIASFKAKAKPLAKKAVTKKAPKARKGELTAAEVAALRRQAKKEDKKLAMTAKAINARIDKAMAKKAAPAKAAPKKRNVLAEMQERLKQKSPPNPFAGGTKIAGAAKGSGKLSWPSQRQSSSLRELATWGPMGAFKGYKSEEDCDRFLSKGIRMLEEFSSMGWLVERETDLKWLPIVYVTGKDVAKAADLMKVGCFVTKHMPAGF